MKTVLHLTQLLQKAWRKRRYQYLQYFMLPKHLRYEPESEVYNTGLVGIELPNTNNEDSNGNTSSVTEKVILFHYKYHFPFHTTIIPFLTNTFSTSF